MTEKSNVIPLRPLVDKPLSGLTERQDEIWRYMAEQFLQHGVFPTHREIATRFSFKSAAGAFDHLKALIRKGYAEASEGRSRSTILKVFPPWDPMKLAPDAFITRVMNAESWIDG